MGRNVGSLFQGRKPRSLWGNAGNSERKQYKDQLSISKKKKSGLVETHKTILPMHRVRDVALRSRLLIDYLTQHFCTPQTRMLFRRFQLYSEVPTSQTLAQMISRNPGKRKKALVGLLREIKSAREDMSKVMPKVRQLTNSAPKLNAKISKTIPRRYKSEPLKRDLALSTEDILDNHCIDAGILLRRFEEEVELLLKITLTQD